MNINQEVGKVEEQVVIFTDGWIYGRLVLTAPWRGIVEDGGCRFGRCSLDIFGRGGGRAGELRGNLGEVEVSRLAFDGESGNVVRSSRHLRRRECSEPNSRLLPGFADLRHPFSPAAHSHTAVCGVLPIISTLPLPSGFAAIGLSIGRLL